jgi:hypothetical protein
LKRHSDGRAFDAESRSAAVSAARFGRLFSMVTKSHRTRIFCSGALFRGMSLRHLSRLAPRSGLVILNKNRK